MKTLEELIEYLEARSSEHTYPGHMTIFSLSMTEVLQLLPGLRQAQSVFVSERQQVKELSDSYKKSISDANSLRDKLGEAQKELDGSVFVPSITSDSTSCVWVLASDYDAQTKELEAARAEIETLKIKWDVQLCDRCSYWRSPICPCKCGQLATRGGYQALKQEIERLTQALKEREGWKLVPVLPTDEMEDAGRAKHSCDQEDRFYGSIPMSYGEASDIYKAMIAAAPTPTEDEVK